MSKRLKVLIAVLVAILMLTAGGVATVMADDGSTATENETGRKGLQARVAEILGIPSDNLTSAFEQARQEIRDEAFIRYLDKAVEKGLIDEVEAGEIEAWWGNRPEALDRLVPCARTFLALHSRHMWGARINPAILGKHMWGGYKGWQRPGLPELADQVTF